MKIEATIDVEVKLLRWDEQPADGSVCAKCGEVAFLRHYRPIAFIQIVGMGNTGEESPLDVIVCQSCKP